MKKQDEIEELFSSTFADFQHLPPLDVKSAIDDQLFNEKTPVSGHRKGFLWFSSSIILIGIVSFLVFKNAGNRNPILAKNVSTQQENSNSSLKTENKQADNQKVVVKAFENKSPETFNNQSNEEKLSQKKELTLNQNSFSERNNDYKIAEIKIGSGSPKNSTVKDHPTKNITSNSFIVDNKDVTTIQSTTAFNPENQNEKNDHQTNSVFSNEVIAINTESLESVNKDEERALSQNDNKVEDNLVIQNTNSVTVVNVPLASADQPAINAHSPWSISLYSGGTYGSSFLRNFSTKNYKIREQVGFSSSIEVNYNLNSRFGVSAGFDVNSRKDIFNKSIEAGDSILTGYSTQYIYLNPELQDSIIGSLDIPIYSEVTSSTTQEQTIQHTSYAIPIFFAVHLLNKGNWNMILNSGLRFSYVQNKLVSNPIGMSAPEFKKFGMRVNLRPEISYSIKKFGIGCYVNLGYDIIPAIKFRILNTSPQPAFQHFEVGRTRIDYGFGLVLKYQL